MYVCMYVCIYLSNLIYLPTYICLSIHPSIHPFIHPSIHVLSIIIYLLTLNHICDLSELPGVENKALGKPGVDAHGVILPSIGCSQKVQMGSPHFYQAEILSTTFTYIYTKHHLHALGTKGNQKRIEPLGDHHFVTATANMITIQCNDCYNRCSYRVLWVHSRNENKYGTVEKGITGKMTFNLGLER